MENDQKFGMKNDKNGGRNLVNKDTREWKFEEKARKDGIAFGVVTTAIISFIILLAGVVFVNSRYNKDRQKNMTELETQGQLFSELLATRDSVINEWVLLLDQIEKDLNLVKEKENIITFHSTDKELTKDRKEQILKDIAYINSLLDKNKKKIASLTTQLKRSGSAIKGLEKKIEELDSEMKIREKEIVNLKLALADKDLAIEELNTHIADLQTTVADKDEKINRQIDKMNEAFITFGTYKDLKHKGVIERGNGFLGLGRKHLTENFADSSFSQINIEKTRKIMVDSKIAKLITEHPAGSYELIHDSNNKIAGIDIKDPEQFWKISKYAVVEIRN